MNDPRETKPKRKRRSLPPLLEQVKALGDWCLLDAQTQRELDRITRECVPLELDLVEGER